MLFRRPSLWWSVVAARAAETGFGEEGAVEASTQGVSCGALSGWGISGHEVLGLALSS